MHVCRLAFFFSARKNQAHPVSAQICILERYRYLLPGVYKLVMRYKTDCEKGKTEVVAKGIDAIKAISYGRVFEYRK